MGDETEGNMYDNGENNRDLFWEVPQRNLIEIDYIVRSITLYHLFKDGKKSIEDHAFYNEKKIPS